MTASHRTGRDPAAEAADRVLDFMRARLAEGVTEVERDAILAGADIDAALWPTVWGHHLRPFEELVQVRAGVYRLAEAPAPAPDFVVMDVSPEWAASMRQRLGFRFDFNDGAESAEETDMATESPASVRPPRRIAAGQPSPDSEIGKVLAAVQAAAGPVTAAEVVAATGAGEGAVRANLSELKRRGILESAGPGLYRLASEESSEVGEEEQTIRTILRAGSLESTEDAARRVWRELEEMRDRVEPLVKRCDDLAEDNRQGRQHLADAESQIDRARELVGCGLGEGLVAGVERIMRGAHDAVRAAGLEGHEEPLALMASHSKAFQAIAKMLFPPMQPFTSPMVVGRVSELIDSKGKSSDGAIRGLLGCLDGESTEERLRQVLAEHEALKGRVAAMRAVLYRRIGSYAAAAAQAETKLEALELEIGMARSAG